MTRLDEEQVYYLLDMADAVSDAIRARVRNMTQENFDGSACKSIPELAAANRCSELKAAVYATQELDGDLYKAGCQFMKEFSPDKPFTETESATIMLTFDKPTAMQLAIERGNLWDSMHVTLAYFPSVSEDDVDDIVKACMKTASEFQPFVARANGLTRFSTEAEDPEDAMDAVVVNIDSWNLNRIRTDVLAHLKEYGIQESLAHGFTPHCTLGWIKPDEDMPIGRWSPMDARIVNIEVWRGNKHTALKLGTPYQVEEDNPDPDTTVLAPRAPENDYDDHVAAIVAPTDVPLRKDVYRGPGSVPNRGRAVKRRRRIIQRARVMIVNPATERKWYLQ